MLETLSKGRGELVDDAWSSCYIVAGSDWPDGAVWTARYEAEDDAWHIAVYEGYGDPGAWFVIRRGAAGGELK
jgi:hypothetical protein